MDQREKLFSIRQKIALMHKQSEDEIFQPRLLDEVIVEVSQLHNQRALLDELFKVREEARKHGLYP